MSRATLTANDLFKDKPEQKMLYLQVKKYLDAMPGATEKITKTQISYAGKRQFAWIWLPMEWDKRRPPGCIILSFTLQRRITDPKIVEAVEPYPGRWIHHIIITKKEDFTPDIQQWLDEACRFGFLKLVGKTAPS